MNNQKAARRSGRRLMAYLDETINVTHAMWTHTKLFCNHQQPALCLVAICNPLPQRFCAKPYHQPPKYLNCESSDHTSYCQSLLTPYALVRCCYRCCAVDLVIFLLPYSIPMGAKKHWTRLLYMDLVPPALNSDIMWAMGDRTPGLNSLGD